MKNKTLFATIFGLLVSTTIVKVLNFLKELQISYFYGTSEIVDHFNILMLGPNISLSTIAPAFGLILVAYLSNEKKELIISYKEMLFFCGTILLLFFISIISQTIYSGFSLFEISVSFFISMLFLIQVLLIYYLHSFNAFNEGSISSMIQIIVNITVISLSFFMKSYLLLIVGLIIGLLIQIIYLFNKIIKKKFNSNLIISKGDSSSFIHSFVSVVMGFGLIEILISTQKIFAVSFDIEGLVSSINYSYKVMNLPISIFLFSVLSVLFPTMTKIKDQKELDKIAINLLSAIFFVMLPFTVILFNYAEFIISILFERGEFGKQSVSITASQLKSFSLLLIPLSFFAAQLRIVFVQKKWSKIYCSGLMIITFSIVLNLIAIQYSSLILFSYSLPIAYISSIVIVFKKSLLLSINRDLIKTIIAVLTSIIVTMLINTFLQINQLIIIEICIMIGVYFIMQYLIKNTLLMKILRR